MIWSDARPLVRTALSLSLLLPAAATGACDPGGGSTSNGTDATSDPTAATSTEGSSSDATATTGGTTGATTAGTGATTAGTTGAEEQFCKLGTTGDSTGSDAPWLEVINDGEPLADGQPLTLICGFQGSFMFEVRPYVGGYEPDSDYSDLDVTLEIAGYPEAPDGHLWQLNDYGTFIGCEDSDTDYSTYVTYTYTIQLLLDDEIPDKAVLDGVGATLTVVMNTPDQQTVEVSADLVISAVEDPMWEFCAGY
ncbi:MAG: hypothetical protein H6713_31400 [Myxococcales bacterium]|nr:hypothetical protein [Myxococcales bacterium]MCB9754467.1 hypothetical protein [Myxococcales bacterium]